MNAVLIRWLAGVALIALIAAGGYWAGDHHRNNAWLAKQAVAERDAYTKYENEVRRGEEAAGVFLGQLQELQTSNQLLNGKFHDLRKRTPLVVAQPTFGMACVGPADPSLPPANESPAGAGFSPRLTAAAVWMWNSALVGINQPAGACSLADTSEAACAAATELTLDNAWANQATNAQLCAEDRLAHQRLIDFLKTAQIPAVVTQP